MIQPTDSYLQVHYELRPAKQVERRMLIEVLHMLAEAGCPVREYQYTGMGSVYFVDFVLFHKLLGIDRMLSVEFSPKAENRVRFNRPFDCVDIHIGPIGEVIPALSRDRRHFLWLDYDMNLCAEHLEDVVLAAAHLSPGSLLLVTVDAEPPGDEADGPEEWRQYFLREAPRYAADFEAEDYADANLPRVNAQIVERAIRTGLAGRPQVKLLPLFHFLYADGHRMLTLGGIIGGQEEARWIRGSRATDAVFVRLDLKQDPYRIRVPKLTRKERLYLDCAMPCADAWRPESFDLDEDDIAAYRQIYRFFPAYAELLL